MVLEFELDLNFSMLEVPCLETGAGVVGTLIRGGSINSYFRERFLTFCLQRSFSLRIYTNFMQTAPSSTSESITAALYLKSGDN